jgi:hypothetical protein
MSSGKPPQPSPYVWGGPEKRTVELPDGREVEVTDSTAVEVTDVVWRQVVLPVGSALHVPPKQQWVVVAMSVLPHYQYTPPGAGERDTYAFGDVLLDVAGTAEHWRANALTLMDRYWGRYNLNPELREAVTKLEEAQYAVSTAPSLPELGLAVEKALDLTKRYSEAAAPEFAKPAVAPEGSTLAIEQVECEVDDDIHAPIKFTGLDVELLLVIRRPV